MEVIEKLVNITYDKIFFEDSHLLNSDLYSLKGLILKNQKLLKTSLEKALFISDLAKKIRTEKIEEALQQKKEYGQVLMQNYEAIESLYYWLDASTIEEKKVGFNNSWTRDKLVLENLSKSLCENSFTENEKDFYNIIIDQTYNKRVNWLSTKVLLIYLFERLKVAGSIRRDFSENSFIEGSFLLKGKPIKNVKQSKDAKNNNKNSKPQYYELIDRLLEAI